MSHVVMPLPLTDFDPTEASVSWKLLTENGVRVTFATPGAAVASGDPRMVTGQGLGPWALLLRADRNGLAAYRKMTGSPEFLKPIDWASVKANDFDGIVLPGGHAPGMKSYLESTDLQSAVADFFQARKLVGAICHGVVLAARSHDSTGKSVLAGRRVTALLRSQELAAWGLTCLWLGNYYRTYPETVQVEVTRALGGGRFFLRGPLPISRDSSNALEKGFVVEDDNLVTARWPGDAHRFGTLLARRLTE